MRIGFVGFLGEAAYHIAEGTSGNRVSLRYRFDIKRQPIRSGSAPSKRGASGRDPAVVADGARALGVGRSSRTSSKAAFARRFAELRRHGHFVPVMITGDNKLTAAAIAAEAGVDDFLAEATPEAPAETDPRAPAAGGRLVAMCGDGTNGRPGAGRKPIVAVAMNTGTQAAKEAGNMVTSIPIRQAHSSLVEVASRC